MLEKMMKVIIVLVVVLALNASADDNKKKECIKKKMADSLKNFTNCMESRKKMIEIRRIKECYKDEMVHSNVVMIAKDGQMTVNYDKFGEYGQKNNNDIGKAMKDCHKDKKKDDRMYQEAARASQCVFDKLKTTCK